MFGREAGWEQDYPKAMALWRLSAEVGVASSQFMLAEMYRLGQGVEVDRVEAYAWYRLALGNGYKLAGDSLVELARSITAEERHKDILRLQDYRRRYKAR
ncbi:tetratricopeptide repeat protein [endosymbiont of Ridgeia piscesae]|uniref:tetratricopeptide repeat protein n=1 Tax=endosymbiont of Ridgeia piscesae TaxID=54398 RepID=UPI0012F8AF3F|nr:SEL1-like repeat protein [endosymbiont of Ridgeia piscesae]